MGLEGRLRAAKNLKIWAAIILPSLAALISVVMLDADSLQAYRAAGQMQEAVALIRQADAVIFDLQRERGLAGMAAGSGFDPLLLQRWKAQAAIGELHREQLLAGSATLPDLPPEANLAWQAVLNDLQQLAALRRRLAAAQTDGPPVQPIYSEAVESLIDLTESLQGVAVGADGARRMIALANIVRTTEALGQERAVGVAAVAGRAIPPSARARLLELSIEQAARLAVARLSTNARERGELDQAVNDNSALELMRMRAKLQNGDLDGVTADGWFSTAGAGIDRLRHVGDGMTDDLARVADDSRAGALFRLLVNLLLVAVLLAFGGRLLRHLVRLVAYPAEQLADARRQLSEEHAKLLMAANDWIDDRGDGRRAVLLCQTPAQVVERNLAG